MSLKDERIRFSADVGRLLAHLNDIDIDFMLDEVKRDPRVAKLNAASGAGISKSLHVDGLAVDIDLLDDDYNVITDGGHRYYVIAGSYWKSLDEKNCWGGDFGRVDSRHFSRTYGGRK